jgi:hypothetical protein
MTKYNLASKTNDKNYTQLILESIKIPQSDEKIKKKQQDEIYKKKTDKIMFVVLILYFSGITFTTSEMYSSICQNSSNKQIINQGKP